MIRIVVNRTNITIFSSLIGNKPEDIIACYKNSIEYEYTIELNKDRYEIFKSLSFIHDHIIVFSVPACQTIIVYNNK